MLKLDFFFRIMDASRARQLGIISGLKNAEKEIGRTMMQSRLFVLRD